MTAGIFSEDRLGRIPGLERPSDDSGFANTRMTDYSDDIVCVAMGECLV